MQPTNPFQKSSLILAIGPKIHFSSQQVTGQAMMFQLSLNALLNQNKKVKIFDTSEYKNPAKKLRVTSRFGWKRLWEYVRIMPGIWSNLLFYRKVTIYMATAPSFWGFLRDAIVIWPAFFTGHSIVGHQFGWLYDSFYSKQSKFIQLILRTTLHRLEALVVEGEAAREQFFFISQKSTKIYAIPNALPTELTLVSKPRTINHPQEPFCLLFMSSMMETKGYWEVLQATQQLVAKGHNIQCYFAGRFRSSRDSKRFCDPVLAKKAFRDFIEQHNLGSVVVHSDFLWGEEKEKILNKAHMFLLPSSYINEGQPIAVLEAMAYGLVVIASQHRLIPSMVEENKTGFFVNYGQSQEIVEKVEYLLKNPEIYQEMSQKSIEKVKREFSVERYCSQVLKIIESSNKNGL